MPKRDPFTTEHHSVLEALAHGDVAVAEQQLRAHLEASCVKVTQRIALVQRNYAKPALPYIGAH